MTLEGSYSTIELHLHMAVQTGLEPAVSSVTGKYVTLYYTTEPWCDWWDSNPQVTRATIWRVIHFHHNHHGDSDQN